MHIHPNPTQHNTTQRSRRPQWKKKKVIYTKSRISHHSTSPPQTPKQPLPPKPTLDILPSKINLHNLLPLHIRINRAHDPLRPVQRALVTLLRFRAHETEQIARDACALALDVAEVLLNAAAQRVDALAHFLGVVVVGEEVAAGFAGGGGA